MKGKTGELWYKLCAEAADEQDPERFFNLIKQIKDMLEAKQKQLRAPKSSYRKTGN